MTPTLPNDEFEIANDYENFLILPDINNNPNNISIRDNNLNENKSRRLNSNTEEKDIDENSNYQIIPKKENFPKI